MDGKKILKSDESFLCRENSFVVHNQLRSGEIFDARLYSPDWNKLDFDDSDWKNAVTDDKIKPYFKKCECEPVREMKTLSYKSCTKTEEGYLLDYGVNISGYIRAFIDMPEGTKVVFRHAEEVYPDGRLKLNGLNVLYPSVDFQTDRYICGKKNYLWSPKFTYHGFRYVLIEGLSAPPDKKDIKAVIVHQNVKKISEFSSSDRLLNKIYSAGIRSVQSNMMYSLTDCPTREKFGWTNDAQASCEQILINFDSKRFFEKWLEDFKFNMLPDGQIPAIVPTHGYGYGHGPVADGSFFEIPYRIYQYTGDSGALIGCLTYFKKYYNYFTSDKCDETDWLCDWDGFTNHDIGKDFIRLIYTVKICDIIIFTMKFTGEDSGIYKRDRKNAMKALKKFIDKDGRCSINSQSAVAALICFNAGDKHKLIGQLKNMIDIKGGHFDCGMFGIQYIYKALSDNGEGEYAYKIITAKGAPGFENWFSRGATTLWETWVDSGFTDSRNHHMYSNVLQWFFVYLLGIKADKNAGGYKKDEFSPTVIKKMRYCKGSVITPFGKISVKWEKLGNRTEYTVNLPEGIKGYHKGEPLHSGINIINI